MSFQFIIIAIVVVVDVIGVIIALLGAGVVSCERVGRRRY